MTDNMMPELTLEPTAAAEAVPQLTLEPTAPEVPEPEEKKIEPVEMDDKLLTEEEKQEQALLRQEYLAAIRQSLEAQLDNTLIQEPDGTRHRLPKKP